jgi:hypothetical protein
MVATVGRSVLNRCPTSADRHSEAFSRRIAEHDLLKKQAEAALGDLVTLTTRHLRKGDKLLMGMAICARLDLPISVKRGTKPPPLSRRGIDQSGNSA